MKLFAITILSLLLLSSCNSIEDKAEDRAVTLCKCAEKASVPLEEIPDRMFFGLEDAQMSCAKNVLKGIQADMKGLGKKEQSKYIKAFVNAGLETKCGETLLFLFDPAYLDFLINDF